MYHVKQNKNEPKEDNNNSNNNINLIMIIIIIIISLITSNMKKSYCMNLYIHYFLSNSSLL